MRNRYLDLLRAAATVRVVVYHSSGWAALTIVFPAMSVMFALAGSMMAASLDRHGPRAVERRLHRLLPALWALVAVAVPCMLVGGLVWDWKVLLWAFPLEDPPATGFWLEGLAAMWYLRDFLWFVLVSPLILPVFRRFPLITLAIPYAGLAVITFAGLTPPAVLRDFCLYGSAWLLGFAHHDGLLSRGSLLFRHRWWLAGVLGAAAAAWALTHPGPRGLDLNDIPLANALWSTAFILIALSVNPAIPSRRALTVLNARALTIYLWHVPLILLVVRLAEATGLPVLGWVGISWRLVVVAALLALAVMAIGWVEDWSAGRRPTLIPGGRPRAVPVSPAPVSAAPVSAAPVSAAPVSAAPVSAAPAYSEAVATGRELV
ncbi:membrane protein [Paractinoplanes deccanensis]|uniref:Membrane protein n=1 Tax=Paractinoplanes deccanensis TaxID=113561 RepID=A0ABQ3Y694_9ACTN|nr:acyltransferase [Actinoplanes deccanensis]GID75516.1 membrane protein [Actinoplanes deccanensis]